MTQFLSLAIDENRLRGVLADVSGGRVEVCHFFEAEAPQSLLTGSPAENQNWLRQKLQQLGISADQTLLTVAKDAGIVRRLELPSVPADELPIHVGFQARTKLAQPLDSLIWDFLPQPHEKKGNAVLLTALPKNQFQNLINSINGAGLKPLQCQLTSVPMMEFVIHGETSRRAQSLPPAVVIQIVDERLEISLLQEGTLTGTHSGRLNPNAPFLPQVLSEVMRGTLALQKQIPHGIDPRILVAANRNRNAEVCRALSASLGKTPDELSLPATIRLPQNEISENFSLSSYAEPLGMLLARAGTRAESINFLSPRRPLPKRDHRKRRIAILAAGIVAIVATGGGLYARQWSAQGVRIKRLTAEEQALDKFLQRGTAILNSGTAVETWQKSKVDWFQEVRELTSHFPTSDRLHLTGIQLDPVVGSNAARQRGTISLRGMAKERVDVIRLEEKLVKLPHDQYQVLPHKAKLPPTPPPGSPAPPQKPYPVEFDLTVNLGEYQPPKPEPKKPEESKPPENKPTEEKKPSDEKKPDSASGENPESKPTPETPPGNTTPPADQKPATESSAVTKPETGKTEKSDKNSGAATPAASETKSGSDQPSATTSATTTESAPTNSDASTSPATTSPGGNP